MFVQHKFVLNTESIERIRAVKPEFGFNGFGEVTYYRTYSRQLENGGQEHWGDTVVRVVQGVISIRKSHMLNNYLQWDENYWQNYALDFGLYLANMRFLPPGRGLWAMGTKHVDRVGSAALNNCGAVDTTDFIAAADWAMDMLMHGVGVGFNTAWKGCTKVSSDTSTSVKFVVQDSREGWVASLRYLLGCYIPHSKKDFKDSVSEDYYIKETMRNKMPEFDYSVVRPAGAVIHGFGGIASGPEPLIKLHERVHAVMKRYLKGEINEVRCVADVMNSIGACVVAGNIRRSAQIALGNVNSDTFLNLKNYSLNPERMEIGWMSNNTVMLEKDEDFLRIPEIAERIRDNGEPGIFNLINIQKFGRFTDEMPDKATLSNPCSEIPLESYELCNLAEVFPTRCVNEQGELNDAVLYQAIKYATFYASTVSLLATHRSETNAVIARNRRIGVSLSGVADWMDKIGAAYLSRKLRQCYKIVRAENTFLAEQAGVPKSIRVTTIKPSGTISQLAGVSSGVHFPTFKYAIRRIRIAMNSPIADVLVQNGVPHEKDVYSDNTYVFEFPIDQGCTRKATDVSAWEQFSLLTMMQRHYSDNMVSCTVYFDKETEGNQIEQMLGQYIHLIKSVSMLPHTEAGAYAQMPYEGITKEQYEERLKNLKAIDWSSFCKSDGMDSKFCTNESCDITFIK
jgi:ribonucleoside-diphosphate reductase alpha chain